MSVKKHKVYVEEGRKQSNKQAKLGLEEKNLFQSFLRQYIFTISFLFLKEEKKEKKEKHCAGF